MVNLYKKENDPKVKERLLLIIKVREDEQIPFRVVKEMHRSNPWASDWLKRYDKEGIEGLKDRTKSGRPPNYQKRQVTRLRKNYQETNQGWTTKQVEELIIKKSGIKYHYTHIYRILRKWGFKQKVPRKVHVNTASAEEKEAFKKRSPRYLWIEQAAAAAAARTEFTIVSLDESFFFYDSLVRRVWIDENKRPVVRVTGSHKHSCIFGAISMEGKQIFRQYDIFNGDTFLDYLKKIHSKFPKCYLFMDKASPHYKSKKVLKYFEDNKDTLIPVYLPTASPEFMVMEEVWNIAKRDLLVLKYYSSFADFKE